MARKSRRGHHFSTALADRVDIVLTRKDAHGATILQMSERADPEQGRGIYIAAVTRLESRVPALPGIELNCGDVLTLVGAKADVLRGGT
ncbi:hypothetical protein [Paraburkholderia hospita]|uniref:hypothetical protein n=1 Tax=Paraburkholderia hospita TaxID=169430 RepID=UPI001872D2D7|nr:hypothetical protein [Paraburkholderia hospita]